MRPFLIKAIVLLFFVSALPLYFLALQGQKALRFEVGSMDRDYLQEPDDFYARLRMSGPIRNPDDSVEVIDFYGRFTRRRAVFSLPYHALRSPLRLRIRCHRFGLDGRVVLAVNGSHIGDFVFTDRSYPWGGFHAVIPEEIAESGPLEIEIEVRDAEPSREPFPKDFGLGVDWIEVEPFSKGVRVLPTFRQVAFALLFTFLGVVFIRRTGASWGWTFFSAGAGWVIVASGTYFFQLETAMITRRLWILFPLGWLIHWGLSRLSFFGLSPVETGFLSRLFVSAALVHSLLIFFPNHAPPDLWNHLPQIEWLANLDLTQETLYRYSTSVDVFDDGHVRPRFGADYGAPYPPFFYFVTYALTRVHDDGRFLVEFFPVLLGASMILLVYLIAKVVWKDMLVARFAAVLLVTEISLWHHVHRVHSPGIFGELFVLLWLLFLAAGFRTLTTRRGFLLFAFLSGAAVLSYTAALVQTSMMAAVFVVLLLVSKVENKAILAVRISAGFAVGLAAALALYYGPYVYEAIMRRDILLNRGVYDPPAAFYFLRNQMRDTVRILRNGYPLYVILSLAGWILLSKDRVVGEFHRRLLLSGGLTYLIMLVLKDPALMPQVFLHAKEDLFYVPLACLLSGLVLSRLWRTRGWGRPVVALIFLVFLGLAVRDQAFNANTLHEQVVAR